MATNCQSVKPIARPHVKLKAVVPDRIRPISDIHLLKRATPKRIFKEQARPAGKFRANLTGRPSGWPKAELRS